MKPPTVLIVDSDPRDLAKHAAILTEARYTVLQASGFPEAVAILARHRGKLIVLSDLNVGGESGLKFLDDTLRKYPFLPFIFTATSPPLNSVLGALRQGAYDFIRLPVPPDILLHSVARAVQKLSLALETEKQEKEIRKLLDRSREDLKDARTHSSFKGFMISMAAHDFRSIITVLDGTLQVIKERCTGCDVTDPGGILEQADPHHRPPAHDGQHAARLRGRGIRFDPPRHPPVPARRYAEGVRRLLPSSTRSRKRSSWCWKGIPGASPSPATAER